MDQDKKTTGRDRPDAGSLRFRNGTLRVGDLGPARVIRFGGRPGPVSRQEAEMIRLLLGSILNGAEPAGPYERRIGRARVGDILRKAGLSPVPDGPRAAALALEAFQEHLSLAVEPKSRPEGSPRILYALLKVADYDPEQDSLLVYSPYLDGQLAR